MRRRAATWILGASALLLVPGAPGAPEVPGDPTPPVVAPVVVGTLGNDGWHISNVTVNWSVTDPESIILSTTGCNATTFTTDTTGTQRSCSATSDGGTTSVTKTFKVDKTAPSASASASRPPDTKGWYNHALSVSFSGSDATSGIASCTAARTYNGPDDATVSISGSCTDRAGNSISRALTLKYDATPPQLTPAPSRAPNANGWYRQPLTIGFPGTDATSGIQACSAQQTYQGPDNANASVGGSCTDVAGNTTARAFALRYDETPPVVTGAPVRLPDHGDWYNQPVVFTLQGHDATSGVDGACTTANYSGPDSGSASISGSCRDKAGNPGTGSVAFKYDATGPQLTPAPSRAPSASGWYRQPLTIAFPGADSTSGIQVCSAEQTYHGPDNAMASVPGSCTDRAGNTTTRAFALRYDETAPTLTASPSRPPDSNGWYTRALTVSFSGGDATSGIEGCSSAGYSGADDTNATVAGSCRDIAGNVTGGSYSFRYDATDPSIRRVHAALGNRSARVAWTASPDTRLVEVRRAPGRKGEAVTMVYRGPADGFRDTGLTVGRVYRYRVTAYDDAANSSSRAMTLTAAGALFNPAPGQAVTAPPRLRWDAVAGARFYNVQLIRGRRMLSVWPRRPSFQLRRTWTYKGRRYRLRPGVYRWYVWPAFAQGRYGRLIGSSRFVVKG
jgi:hypothetical protein